MIQLLRIEEDREGSVYFIAIRLSRPSGVREKDVDGLPVGLMTISGISKGEMP